MKSFFRAVLNQSFELIHWKIHFEHVCHFLPNFKSETLISASHKARFLENLMTKKITPQFPQSVLILYKFLPICTWQLQVQIRLELRCCYQLLWSRCIWSLCYKAKWWACKCLRKRLLFSFSPASFPHFSDTLIYNKLCVFLYKACLSHQPAMRETLQSQKLQNADVNNLPNPDILPQPLSVSLDLSVSHFCFLHLLHLFLCSPSVMQGCQGTSVWDRERIRTTDKNTVWVRERFLETMTNLLPNSSELPEKENRVTL